MASKPKTNDWGDPVATSPASVNDWGDKATGGSSSNVGTDATRESAPQTVGHAASEFVSGANPLPGIASLLTTNPLDTIRAAGAAMRGQYEKGKEAWGKGNYVEGAGHYAASALPFIGPTAAAIGEQIGDYKEPVFDKYGNVVDQGTTPDIAGGMARGVGTISGMAAGSALARAAGRGLQSAARVPAKVALKLPGKTEAFGATPSQAILEDTSGFRPATIAKTGQAKINELKPQMESAVSSAKTPIDLAPGRTAIEDAMQVASNEGDVASFNQLLKMRDAMEKNMVTGQQYPPTIPPREALDLKRGFGRQFADYNPDVHENVNRIAKGVRGEINDQIHSAAPEAQSLDQRIQSLIPVVNRAETVSRGAGIGERVLGRMARPTGGMLPGAVGYHEFGIPGLIGGLLGVEATASAVPLMCSARGMYGLGRGIKSAIGQRLVEAGPFMNDQQSSQPDLDKQPWDTPSTPPPMPRR